MSSKVCLMSFILASSLPAMALDKVTVRKMFYAASESKAQTEALHRYLAINGDNSPLAQGYTSMYYMLIARYSYNPFSKLNSFAKGSKMLDAAIVGDRTDTELRFLRFSVQVNAPSFLNYNRNIEEDKRQILDTYSTLADADLKLRIRDFMARVNIALDKKPG